jgi:tRNA(adenine34) deaminase
MMTDQEYLSLAYEEAKLAYAEKETPIGAVLVQGEEIIARGHNQSFKDTDPTEHAEMVVLKEGFRKLKTKNLSSCRLYISLEPCMMCLGGIINAHLKDIFFGALDEKKGAFTHSLISPSIDGLEVHYLKDDKCGQIVTDFFKTVRSEK